MEWFIITSVIAGGIGFATKAGAYGLASFAASVFDGLQSWTCWLITSFLDMLLFIFVTTIGNLPGGFMEVGTVDVLVAFYRYTDRIIPIDVLVPDIGAFIVFYAVWVSLRTIIKLIPTVG